MKKRDFINAFCSSVLGAAFYYSPALRIIENSVRHFLDRDSEIQTRNYLQVCMYGAPSRWFFDNPLKPNDDDPFVSNPMVVTRFKNVDVDSFADIEMEYATTKKHGINFPIFWDSSVPAPNGKLVNADTLLNHALIIRGCRMSGLGHPLSCKELIAPESGKPSINGLIAEKSQRVFKAIGVGRSPVNRSFYSSNLSDYTNIPADIDDYFYHLVHPFLNTSIDVMSKSESISEATDVVLGVLDEISIDYYPNSERLLRDRNEVKRIVNINFESIHARYKETFHKYLDIVNRSYGDFVLSGFNDRPLPGMKLPFERNGKKSVLEVFGRLQVEGKLIDDIDLRESIKGAKLMHFAQQFALAEITLGESLTSSVVIAPEDEMGTLLNSFGSNNYYFMKDIESIYNKEKNCTKFQLSSSARSHAAKNNIQVKMDLHDTGSIPTILGCTLFYRALSSCLIEIIDRFKEIKIFDETVIHVTSEFERMPSVNEETSEHNFFGHVSSIYSGVIKGPIVLGNIYSGIEDSPFPGTTGICAPVRENANRPLNIRNVTSTITSLLRVPSITSRFAPVVVERNNKIYPAIEMARNVAGESPDVKKYFGV